MKKNLHSFFNTKIVPEYTGKKCFIYSQSDNTAFFENNPTAEIDKYVISHQGVRLYIRNRTDIYHPLPVITGYTRSIPLLKSNLQKAIRRGEVSIALTTTVLMLMFDINELLRRLPIICIEDVTCIDTLPVIVWLMMAYPHYEPTNFDMWNILYFVNELCDIEEYYPNRIKEHRTYTHDSLTQYPSANCLLAIYYRSKYGGMEGDMKMMETSIEYYIANPEKIINSKHMRNPLILNIDTQMRILPEAVDFHCYPKMLIIIQNQLFYLEEEDIKKKIWYGSSAYNIRKPETLEKMREMDFDPVWIKIKSLLPEVRDQVIPPHIKL
jgi:hypothetical protein